MSAPVRALGLLDGSETPMIGRSTMTPSDDPDQVLDALNRVLSSAVFQGAARSRELLTLIVDEYGQGAF
jgi:hypothetical protein